MNVQTKIDPEAKSKLPKIKEIFASISPPKMAILNLHIEGISPLMVCRFSEKAMNMMREKHEAGSVAKSKKAREARDFDADFHNARHIAKDGGWDGLNASSFRNAIIDVCRVANFKMTHAKLACFVEADGFDRVDGVPLVKIESPDEPQPITMTVRNATGVVDLRTRPQWQVWEMFPRIRYDENVLSSTDILNLMTRVGLQAGVGEGRPNSRNGAGMGMGLFRIVGATIKRVELPDVSSLQVEEA